MRRYIVIIAMLALAVPAVAAAPASAKLGDRTLRKGSHGKDVRRAQKLLTKLGFQTTVDGYYGRRTARSVRRYERAHDFKVDKRISPPQGRGMKRRVRASRAQRRAAREDRNREPTGTRPAGERAFPIDGPYEWADGFGDRGGRHKGVDLLADCGLPLVAAEAGEVVFSDHHSAAGHYAVIRGVESGEDHVYMHLRRGTRPAKGDEFVAGQRIGSVGRSGNATTCHLHFEIWTAPGWYRGGSARDPEPELRSWERRR